MAETSAEIEALKSKISEHDNELRQAKASLVSKGAELKKAEDKARKAKEEEDNLKREVDQISLSIKNLINQAETTKRELDRLARK